MSKVDKLIPAYPFGPWSRADKKKRCHATRAVLPKILVRKPCRLLSPPRRDWVVLATSSKIDAAVGVRQQLKTTLVHTALRLPKIESAAGNIHMITVANVGAAQLLVGRNTFVQCDGRKVGGRCDGRHGGICTARGPNHAHRTKSNPPAQIYKIEMHHEETTRWSDPVQKGENHRPRRGFSAARSYREMRPQR